MNSKVIDACGEERMVEGRRCHANSERNPTDVQYRFNYAARQASSAPRFESVCLKIGRDDFTWSLKIEDKKTEDDASQANRAKMEALSIIGIRPFGMMCCVWTFFLVSPRRRRGVSMHVPETTNARTPPKLLMSFLLLASCSQIRAILMYF